MYFGLPDEAVALRDGLRELLTDACTPATIRAAWDGDPCDGLWKQLGSFGVLGLLVEEPKGGLGLDELSMVAALEEAGYHGVPGPLVETVACLPELDLALDGSARIAVMQGFYAPGAQASTHILDIEPGEACIAETTKLDVHIAPTVDRSRGTADRFSGHYLPVHVDSDRVRQRATLGTAALLLGLARRQLDITVDYLKNRKQFGAPIGSFQGLKHPLAEAVVGTEFAWPVVLNAACTMRPRDISHAKAAASDAAYRMSRVCLQAHGAMGYTVEHDLHLFMKRTWALAKDWGTAEEHRARIAEELL